MSLTQPPDATQQPPVDGESTDEDASGAQSVAEVEAYWKNRVSQKDKGHLAAERALREENESLKKRLEAASSQATGSSGQPGDDRALELQRQLEQERTLRLAAERRAKYPALAERVTSPEMFASLDEATLAKLNAELDQEPGGRIAPTSPRRTAPTTPKRLEDMSKAELEAEMRRAIDAGAHLTAR